MKVQLNMLHIYTYTYIYIYIYIYIYTQIQKQVCLHCDFNLTIFLRIDTLCVCVQLRPTSIEKEIFPVMAEEGQLYTMELQGNYYSTNLIYNII